MRNRRKHSRCNIIISLALNTKPSLLNSGLPEGDFVRLHFTSTINCSTLGLQSPVDIKDNRGRSANRVTVDPHQYWAHICQTFPLDLESAPSCLYDYVCQDTNWKKKTEKTLHPEKLNRSTRSEERVSKPPNTIINHSSAPARVTDSP